MSRARNIKPGFFKNDLLAECDPLARILFAGIWCEADREGRLEDRPRRLKAEILPYDDCDIEALLAQLSERGFIRRYEVSGARYIAVVEFLRHQNPHVREMPSVIPPPPDVDHSARNSKQNLGNAQAQPRQCLGDAEHRTSPADSPFPYPYRDKETRGTRAGECARAMRESGCHTLNQSNPDFLPALDEGVTSGELSDAVAEAKTRGISGAGLFTYALGIARTNHAKKAASVAVFPEARAGPPGVGVPQIRPASYPGKPHATPRESLVDRTARKLAEIGVLRE